MRDLSQYVKIGLFALAMRAGAGGIPEIRVPCAMEAPLIDGIITDACWSAAALVDEFRQVGGDSGAVRRHYVRVLRDSRWLYAAFTVDQPEDQRDPPLYLSHDQPVQREDNVQVSFDPGTGGQMFYQFLVNKANTRADFRVTTDKGREREEWNIPWKSAVTTDPRGWQVEIALPLALLTEVGHPEQARMNFIIDCFRVYRDACRVKIGAERECLSWAALSGSSPANAWTEAARFGRLLDLEINSLVAPLLPYIKSAEVSQYYVTNGTAFYDIQADLQLFSSATGTVLIAVKDEPRHGESTLAEKVVFADGSAVMLSARVPVPVAAMTERAVTVCLVDGTTRETWQKLAIADAGVLNLFAAELDRDYYTTESAAYAACRIGMPAETLRDLHLQARLGAQVLASLDAPPPRLDFAVPLDRVPAGEHQLHLELVLADGGAGSVLALPLIKRAPRPGCEWKVDRANQRLLDNGKPFFPCGMIMAGITPADDYAFAEIADAGFNTMYQWSYQPAGDRSDPEGDQVKDMQAYLDAAARHGLKVIAAVDMNYTPFNARTKVKNRDQLLNPEELHAVNRALQHATCSLGIRSKDVILSAIPGRAAQVKTAVLLEYLDNQMPYLAAVLQAGMRHPALAACFIFDEPLLNINYGQIPVGREFYRRIKKLDGYHPVFLNCNPGVYQCSDDWFDWADMLGIDPYWTPEHAGVNGTIDYVAWMAHHLRLKARRMRVVPLVVMQGAEYSGIVKRALLPAEQVCQTYLALIHGVKGIGYFCYPERAQANWDTLRELARRLRRLSPACLEPDLPQTVNYSGGPYDFDARRMPDVHVALKRDPDGGFILLAANVADYPVAVRYDSPLFERAEAIQELFLAAAYPVTAGAFDDQLEPLGVRAYHIQKAGHDSVLDGALAIGVAMQPRGMPPPRTPTYGRAGRVDMKNLAPNPSLEEESIPGRPDYWRQTGTPLKPWERIGGSNQVWGLTTNAPYHGAKCLEMIADGGSWRFIYINLHTSHMTPEKYVFSAWLRADREGVTAKLRAGGKGDTSFQLQRQWQRCSVAFEAGSGASMLGVHFVSDASSTVWVDGLQIERGAAATEFEP